MRQHMELVRIAILALYEHVAQEFLTVEVVLVGNEEYGVVFDYTPLSCGDYERRIAEGHTEDLYEEFAEQTLIHAFMHDGLCYLKVRS